jgi:hypothetical protein
MTMRWLANVPFLRRLWVIRDRFEPTAGQPMCVVPRKRKFPEYYGSSRP